MVIDIGPTGSVEAMHRDAFNLDFLGKQTIQRASDIRFDSDTQKWDIFLAHGCTDEFVGVNEAKGFATYEEARKMEVRWLEMARLHSVSPLSSEGISILNVLRQTLE